MKIVQVAPFPAYPPTTGGQKRVDGLMCGREANQVHRIATDSTLNRGSESKVEIEPGYVEERISTPFDRLSNLGLLAIPGYDTLNNNVLKNFIYQKTKMSIIRRRIDTGDIIIVEHPWLFQLANRCASEQLIVYSSHNFEPELYSDLKSGKIGNFIYSKIREMERKAVAGSDLVVVTSQRDVDLYEQAFDIDLNYHISPNAARRRIDAKVEHVDINSDHDMTLCFIGSNHRPNAIAAKKAIEVVRGMDGVQLYILGAVGQTIKEINVPQNVEITGFVDNLDEYYSRCDLALNPMESGGGSNIKVPECLARGVPVLTSPFGARGVPSEETEGLVIAEIERFREQIRYFQKNKQELLKKSVSAREYIQRQLNWEVVSRNLFEELRKMYQRAHD